MSKSNVKKLKRRNKETQESKPRPLEGICKAGEIMFVPNGWWHMVINLEDSIAIV